MSSNNEAYINTSLFNNPPPNFNSSSPNWQSFKVPPPPPSATSLVPRKYTTEPHSVENYKNGLPPNYPSGSSFQKCTLPPSPEKREQDNSMFNPAYMVQPFKPNIPPPPFDKNASHMLKSHNDSRTPLSETFDEDKNKYYYIPYRRPSSQFTPSSSSFASNVSSEQFPFLPHSLHFPPPQPPLPPLPPPQNPPPPPPPSTMSLTASLAASSRFGCYHRTSPYPMYGQNYCNAHNFYKRNFEGNDSHKKLRKKKKKPMSQVVPQRRDWTMEEAKRALEVEKECNKRSKRQGLVIFFPDLELNKDIVSNFHKSIESVHFQQPSTPRYCFVTLTESADPETVIKQLNQVSFGLGYLSAEFKKDREDEQSTRLTDIDPFTLYVGNLAPEITKENMTTAYPKHKRIDIGYAKKMKYTRYAFVSFYLVDDAIEACQNTYSSQMFSKSLIVRFRRLNGTVGMPKETNQHIKHQFESQNISIADTSNANINQEVESEKVQNTWDIDLSNWDNNGEETKYKRSESSISISEDEDNDEVEEVKPVSSVLCKTNFKPGSLELTFALHKPKIHIKEEHTYVTYEDTQDDSSCVEEEEDNISTISDSPSVKLEIPQLVNRESLDRETEIQTVVENIKQEVTNDSTQISITSYQYLRNLNQQVGVGQLPIPKLQSVKNEQDTLKEEDDATQDNSLSNLATNNNNLKESLLTNSSRTSASDSATSDTEIPVLPNSSNAQNGIDTQELRDVVNIESTSSCTESETTEMNETSDTAFGWMNMDYSTTVIKTELIEDDQVHDGDDDSSDDDMSMENIISRARARCMKTGSF